MGRKKEISGTACMQSIVNNFRVVPDDRMDAARMKFYLHQLKVATGMSEQALMLKMLFFAFEKNSEFDAHRARIVEEWNMQ